MGVRNRVGGWCWVAVVIYFVAQPVVAAAWRPSYSWSRNYISDLGRQLCTDQLCSPRHAVMNAAMVITGALVIAGVIMLWPTLATTRLSVVGLVLIAVGGLGTLLAGLVPTDASPVVHGLAAAVHIPAQAVGILLLGLGSRRTRPVLATVTVLAGVLALVGVVVFFGGLWSAVGAAERLADYPFYAGLVAAGLVLVLHPAARQSPTTHR